MPTHTADVVVVGLGEMGSAAAWQLARRGLRVVGLEQFGPAHSLGSSHGETRLVRQAYYEHPAYVPLMLRAYELWDDLATCTGAPTLHRTGGLMIGPADGTVVSGTVRGAAAGAIPHEVLTPAQLHQRFPAFRLGPDELAVHEPGAGFVSPEATVAAHLDLAEIAGAELHFGAPVRSWATTASGVVVEADALTVQAERLVLAAGAWSPAMLPGVTMPLRVERHVMQWFAPAGDPARFDASRFPVYLWELPDGMEVYGFGRASAGTGIKAAYFRKGTAADPDHLDREVTAAQAVSLQTDLAGRIPGLADRWLSGQACLYTMTPDHHFVIGAVAGSEDRVVVAAGFSGHGFKFVPVVGQILTDLVTTGRTDLPIDLFSPTRFHLETP